MPLTPTVGLAAYVGAICYLVTVIIPVALVSWRMERRRMFVVRAVLSCLVMVLVILVFTVVIQYILSISPQYKNIKYVYLIQYFIILILSGAAVAVCYKCNVWHAFFGATVGYCLQHISARINSIFTELILPPLHWTVVTVIGMVIAAAVYVAFYFIAMRKSKIEYASVSANKYQIFIATCVAGVLIFYNSMGISYVSALIYMAGENASAVGDKALLFVYIMSLLVAVLALVLDLSVCYGNQVKNERDKLESIMDESKRQYEYQKSNVEMLNVKYHDLKHQLGSMKGKIYDEQIDELESAIEIYDAGINTENEALDVVLTQKSFYCVNHGIRLSVMLDGKNYNFMARHELFALFNNAIDNAIEAVEKIDEEKRVISVTEKMSGDLVSVRFENYFSGDVKLVNDMPVTEKREEGHGYGIKSMRMIAEKYGGGIAVSIDGDNFILDVFLNKAEK